MRRDLGRTLPEARALRVAARAWDRACVAPVLDQRDTATGKADRALRRAAERYAEALRSEEE